MRRIHNQRSLQISQHERRKNGGSEPLLSLRRAMV